ncbi:hypothetical protein EVAR_77611_1 [Eumeta japonica]|uniref:Reverse transcriptase domain-containing protein n=1 Tax=Eumeta variegata TaxID=151549 RepID=A0A4C1T7V2_EUMVA|nr:hypothetical protein EVAR_77611_1 [Eumeta japonica]
MFSFTWLSNQLMHGCVHYLEEYDCGLRMDELFVKCLLYADDQIIFALSACELLEMVFERGGSVSCIKDGQHGVCTDINKCQSFYRTIAMKRPPMICSIRASAFVVCCFDGHPSAALTTTTSTLVRSAMNSIKFSRITKRNSVCPGFVQIEQVRFRDRDWKLRPGPERESQTQEKYRHQK